MNHQICINEYRFTDFGKPKKLSSKNVNLKYWFLLIKHASWIFASSFIIQQKECIFLVW